MRLVNIQNIKEGDILARSIYDNNFALLFSEGGKLSKGLINKFKENEITSLYIEDEISKGITLEPILEETFKLKAVVEMKHLFETYSLEKNKGKQIDDRDIKKLRILVSEIVDELLANSKLKYFSVELQGIDMYTYNHCVEVMILSVLIGNKMGFDKVNLNKLAMGAILADIGKIKIPEEIINKKDKLEKSEMNVIKQHTIYGYELIRSARELFPISKQIILFHHERLDGTGYPKQMKGDNIAVPIRIVAMVDIFTAIVSNRAYNVRKGIDQALEILRVGVIEKLDPAVLDALTRVIEVYPKGTLVKLSDGSKGIVIGNNENMPSRPIVRIIKDGKIINEVNLMKELTLFVKQTLSALNE